VDQALGGAQAHADCHQPGLCPVVQVPFHPAQLGGGGIDRVLAGLREPLHPAGQRGQLAAPGERARGQQQRPPAEVSRRPGQDLAAPAARHPPRQEHGEQHRSGD